MEANPDPIDLHLIPSPPAPVDEPLPLPPSRTGALRFVLGRHPNILGGFRVFLGDEEVTEKLNVISFHVGVDCKTRSTVAYLKVYADGASVLPETTHIQVRPEPSPNPDNERVAPTPPNAVRQRNDLDDALRVLVDLIATDGVPHGEAVEKCAEYARIVLRRVLEENL